MVLRRKEKWKKKCFPLLSDPTYDHEKHFTNIQNYIKNVRPAKFARQVFPSIPISHFSCHICSLAMKGSEYFGASLDLGFEVLSLFKMGQSLQIPLTPNDLKRGALLKMLTKKCDFGLTQYLKESQTNLLDWWIPTAPPWLSWPICFRPWSKLFSTSPDWVLFKSLPSFCQDWVQTP